MAEQLIIKLVVTTMKEAQNNFADGKTKKEFVMNIIKESVAGHIYERYEPLISLTIDLIKQIATNKEILKGLQQTKCYGTLFHSCNPKS
jgi:hypothetical protein